MFEKECSESFITIEDPYSVKPSNRSITQLWKLCPTKDPSTTLFESFLNVIILREKTGSFQDAFLIYQANYTVEKDVSLANKYTFLDNNLDDAKCTEVSANSLCLT